MWEFLLNACFTLLSLEICYAIIHHVCSFGFLNKNQKATWIMHKIESYTSFHPMSCTWVFCKIGHSVFVYWERRKLEGDFRIEKIHYRWRSISDVWRDTYEIATEVSYVNWFNSVSTKRSLHVCDEKRLLNRLSFALQITQPIMRRS